MDRNMRSSYVNSGPRSLPHMGGGKRQNINGHNGARLSPPAQMPPGQLHNNNNNNQHDDLINYIYDSWNKVTRELERGNEDARYYQEVLAPRQLANFRPFNLEEWWGRRLVQTINRNKHRS
ncbi:PREDICTED: uncharacterized protein LOC106121500 [Papilio xuthus]|uniref:Uncharacterized protein LOC106121500 n=1 Tax=Papilio xuthus TaxID=66420 RepID=I4DQ82_PAPXU|nr:PREDICTED: uncharacterized protein LOC106121500 [Papilio xuthus]KPJ02107.1 hypothetical protein RR46_03382 [Papilio xuthus]BAM20072.1 unknown unsecreted protein [Papilio xuthus]